MKQRTTLFRELIGASALIYAGALAVAMVGVLLVVPRLSPPLAAFYVLVLLAADIALFSWLAALVLRRGLILPLDATVQAVEAISSGALDTRMPEVEPPELARLSAAVTQMAERLLADREQLTANIRSLDETNRLLTEARDAMVRAENLASVGRLSAGVAHEVGNPLGAILGYLALLGRDPDAKHAELVQAAEREAKRIDRIVRGLLDFARPREVVTQQVDVHRVVRDTLELVQTQGHFTRVELASEFDAPPLHVAGDPYQLQQVLVNLFVNAVDAMAGGELPRIHVSVRRREALPPSSPGPARRREDPPSVDYTHRRRLAAAGHTLRDDPEAPTGTVIEVIVADNGPGISPELLPQIFEPFVTTKEPGKGTGLGLALCARLVEGMGGTVRAQNRAGGGAEFHIVLPALPLEAATP